MLEKRKRPFGFSLIPFFFWSYHFSVYDMYISKKVRMRDAGTTLLPIRPELRYVIISVGVI